MGFRAAGIPSDSVRRYASFDNQFAGGIPFSVAAYAINKDDFHLKGIVLFYFEFFAVLAMHGIPLEHGMQSRGQLIQGCVVVAVHPSVRTCAPLAMGEDFPWHEFPVPVIVCMPYRVYDDFKAGVGFVDWESTFRNAAFIVNEFQLVLSGRQIGTGFPECAIVPRIDIRFEAAFSVHSDITCVFVFAVNIPGGVKDDFQRIGLCQSL